MNRQDIVPLKQLTNLQIHSKCRDLEVYKTVMLRLLNKKLSIFIHLPNNDRFQNSNTCIKKCFHHMYLIGSQNRDILHNVLGD